MKYLGNTPTLELIHEFSHKFDYMVSDNPTASINPATLWATWLNTLTGNVFICISNIPGKNIWKSTTSNRWNGASIWTSVAQGITTGADNVLTFAAAYYDTALFWDALVPTRLTIPNVGITKVRLQAQVSFVTHSSVSRRGASIRKNGSYNTNFGRPLVYLNTPNPSNNVYFQVITPVIDVVPGDFFETTAYQDSGSTLNTAPDLNSGNVLWFAIEAIE